MEILGRILVKCLRYRQCESISSFKKYRHYKYPLTSRREANKRYTHKIMHEIKISLLGETNRKASETLR